jgi:desulfoferrodoxin (superoxide reductase-like protein)
MNRRDMLKTLGTITLLSSVVKAKEVDKYLEEPKVAADIEMRIKDINNMTKSEKMHSPTITINKNSINKRGTILVEISTGAKGKIHKSTKKHYIPSIKFYMNGKLAGKADLSADISRGYLAVRVKESELKGELEAVSVCNLHGTWRTKMKKINGEWKNIRL